MNKLYEKILYSDLFDMIFNKIESIRDYMTSNLTDNEDDNILKELGWIAYSCGIREKYYDSLINENIEFDRIVDIFDKIKHKYADDYLIRYKIIEEERSKTITIKKNSYSLDIICYIEDNSVLSYWHTAHEMPKHLYSYHDIEEDIESYINEVYYK